MEQLNLDPVIQKIDQKKLEELGQIVDKLNTLNAVVIKLDELHQSGALDTLLNLAYGVKTMRDMLNDEALQNLGDMMSGLAEIVEKVSDPEVKKSLQDLMANMQGLSSLSKRLSDLESSGTLDVLMNGVYAIKTMKDMLNDEALQNVSGYISSLLELLKGLDEKSVASLRSVLSRAQVLDSLMKKLEDLQSSGALDTVLEMAYGLKTMKDMINEEALANIAKPITTALEFMNRGQEFLEYFNTPFAKTIATVASSKELAKVMENPPQMSLGSLISSFRDPDVQKGYGIIVTFLKVLGASAGKK